MCIMTKVTTGGKLEKGGQLVYLDSIYGKSASGPLIYYHSIWAPLGRQKNDSKSLPWCWEMLWWCRGPWTPACFGAFKQACVGAHGCWQPISNKEVFQPLIIIRIPLVLPFSHRGWDDLVTLNHTRWLVPSTESDLFLKHTFWLLETGFLVNNGSTDIASLFSITTLVH